MSVEDFIISVYCIIDDEIKALKNTFTWRKRGPSPRLSDAEALTMGIVGEFMKIDSEKQIWLYFREHWRHLFPNIGSRTSLTRQLANIWSIKDKIRISLLKKMRAKSDHIYIVDGFPMPICNVRRAPILKIFKGVADYSYCKSKALWYYGFHGHVLINSEGVVIGLTVTPASASEREAVWEISEGIQGILIGDKGYFGKEFQSALKAERNISLWTPTPKRVKQKKEPKQFVGMMLNQRKKVETVIGKLTEQFNIQKVRARDIWHLTSRVFRKILTHTIGVYINKMRGNPPLQFERLIN